MMSPDMGYTGRKSRPSAGRHTDCGRTTLAFLYVVRLLGCLRDGKCRDDRHAGEGLRDGAAIHATVIDAVSTCMNPWSPSQVQVNVPLTVATVKKLISGFAETAGN